MMAWGVVASVTRDGYRETGEERRAPRDGSFRRGRGTKTERRVVRTGAWHGDRETGRSEGGLGRRREGRGTERQVVRTGARRKKIPKEGLGWG